MTTLLIILTFIFHLIVFFASLIFIKEGDKPDAIFGTTLLIFNIIIFINTYARYLHL